MRVLRHHGNNSHCYVVELHASRFEKAYGCHPCSVTLSAWRAQFSHRRTLYQQKFTEHWSHALDTKTLAQTDVSVVCEISHQSTSFSPPVHPAFHKQGHWHQSGDRWLLATCTTALFCSSTIVPVEIVGSRG